MVVQHIIRTVHTKWMTALTNSLRLPLGSWAYLNCSRLASVIPCILCNRKCSGVWKNDRSKVDQGNKEGHWCATILESHVLHIEPCRSCQLTWQSEQTSEQGWRVLQGKNCRLYIQLSLATWTILGQCLGAYAVNTGKSSYYLLIATDNFPLRPYLDSKE